ncbi:sigma-70 family RNA polymerase sigma factor [Paraburkholderia bonniea]|uniref:RNA polymerase sigma factor n=1 Tax=Paraburkholderia bonniea TaxID=2152891 RepID=UPI001C2CA5E5|nr:sigma-70 family RNA polymerase sigma factor [Paraburkholderia bonniea]WJF89333.1 sigma-70 family RNA polymerase sigma factor [Paraburkholderia bonniea]WJF92649.1 sigma-70 family RNA polymerase sigma factor [Paraburkholderia bonniea]
MAIKELRCLDLLRVVPLSRASSPRQGPLTSSPRFTPPRALNTPHPALPLPPGKPANRTRQPCVLPARAQGWRVIAQPVAQLAHHLAPLCASTDITFSPPPRQPAAMATLPPPTTATSSTSARADTTHPSATSEAALLQRIAQRDAAALTQLHRLYRPRLERYLRRLTRKPHLIDEVINDVLLVVWNKAARFRGDSRISTWIIGIAYRAMRSALRQEEMHADELLISGAEADEIHALLPWHDADELSDWLQHALALLTPEHQQVLELAYVLGHSMEEISRHLRCPLTTVKARMVHARARLRTLLPALATPHGRV